MHYPVMTERQLAFRWKISLKTLRRWRLRTARSRTSGAYLVNLLLMAPSSQGLEPPGKAGRFSGEDSYGV